MHDRIEKILAWQDQERRLFNLQKTILEIPAEVEAVKQRAAAFVQKEADAKNLVKESEKKINRIQLDIDGLRAKIGEANAKSNDLRDNDLYRKLMDTIDGFKERISDLETEELEEMERQDEHKAALKAVLDSKEAAKKQIAADVQDLKTRAANVTEQVKDVEVIRDQKASEADPEVLKVAQRLVVRSVPGKRFNPALVPVQNGNCGSCHMKLTSNTINSAKKGSGICDTCGAMVYVEGL